MEDIMNNDVNLIDILDEVFEDMKKTYQCFEITNEGIKISKDRVNYFVDWDRVKSEKELLNWVIHFFSKKWVTKDLLITFIEIVN